MNYSRSLLFISILAALLFTQFTPQPTTAQTDLSPIPIIIDTDMAIEDWIAILYAVQRADLNVRAVTVSGNGETHCDPGVQNTMNLLALAGNVDIPVACGSETSLQGSQTFPAEWRDWVDAMLGLELPVNPNAPSDLSAVELMWQTLQQSDQPVALLSLGTLTTIAELLQTYPESAERITMIYIMGGAINVSGNLQGGMETDNTSAEWNIYVDPLAADQVIQSGVPITLVPLDATNQVPITRAFYRGLTQDATTPEAEFVNRLLGMLAPALSSPGWYFWDTLTAVAITDENILTFEEHPIRVVTVEGDENGRTIIDETGTVVRVAVDANAVQLEQIVRNVLNGRDPTADLPDA